ncbi:ThuA domain-containing protein [Haladaptatus sp. NG-SE-30]
MAQVTVWNEYRHERDDDEVRAVYPDGIHATLAAALEEYGHDVRTATLDEPEHGLTDKVLAETDVLLWWGHLAHDEVEDDIVARVKRRVLDGMGLVALHSSHESKVFTSLVGTSGSLRWREAGERERIWVVEPSHPVADGIDEYVDIPKAEMYGERFDVPAPDTLVTISWFEGGEVFRSGCCYRRGNGKVFYFRPGHETYPVYHQEEVQQFLHNAVKWANPTNTPPARSETELIDDPLEPLD